MLPMLPIVPMGLLELHGIRNATGREHIKKVTENLLVSFFPDRYALLKMAGKRSSRDGLSSVHYKVIERDYDPRWGYEHIVVQIGSIHKWHFQSKKNKLILHF